MSIIFVGRVSVENSPTNGDGASTSAVDAVTKGIYVCSFEFFFKNKSMLKFLTPFYVIVEPESDSVSSASDFIATHSGSFPGGLVDDFDSAVTPSSPAPITNDLEIDTGQSFEFVPTPVMASTVATFAPAETTASPYRVPAMPDSTSVVMDVMDGVDGIAPPIG